MADHLPRILLRVSTEPPKDLLSLVDLEYVNIAELLKAGRRARGDARAKIRALVALEARGGEDSKFKDADVDRVEKDIGAKKGRGQAFPKLNPLAANVRGEGVTVKVKNFK